MSKMHTLAFQIDDDMYVAINAEVLNTDNLTLTAGLEDGEDYAIVPILTQVEYPGNNSSSYLTLPEDVTLLGYDFTPAEDSSRLLEQTYTETSAAVSGIHCLMK